MSLMKTLELELPDPLAAKLDRAVAKGSFHDAGELTRAALRDFLARGRLALVEQHQLDDIKAAVREAKRMGAGRTAGSR